jgi:DNA-binding MarR family transcriptional regulator
VPVRGLDERDGSAADDAVVDALLSLSRVLVAIAARTLGERDADLTLPQYRTLVMLASYGPQRTMDVAAALGVRPSTVTRTCDRLIRRGLVQRRHRSTDRRVAWLALTEAGKTLVGEVMHRRRAEIARLAAAVPLADPVALSDALVSLVEAAGEVPDPRWWDRWAASTQLDAPVWPGGPWSPS